MTLGALMFLSTAETSIIGRYLALFGSIFFGEFYRLIFSPILVILGVMILVKRASWSVWRLVGIILYYFALTSLVGWYKKENIGYFDIYSYLDQLMGPSSAFLAILVLFFTSIYLTLRISYRTIFSKVRESVPSFASVRDAVIPYDEDIIPSKKARLDDVYKKKAQELEQKLATLQKSKKSEAEIHVPK